jgi:hypothetical protein
MSFRPHHLIPLAAALLVVLAVGVGLALRGSPTDPACAAAPSSPAPAVSTSGSDVSSPRTPSPSANPSPTPSASATSSPTPVTTTAGPTPTTPAAPPPTLTGPDTIYLATFEGFGFSVVGSNFPCGSGGQLTVTIGGNAVPAVSTASDGSATIQFTVSDSQIATSTGFVPFTVGPWPVTVKAGSGCQGTAEATLNVTVAE